MATENRIMNSTFQAQEDLSSYQYHAISLSDGLLANNGGEASGILLSKPESLDFGNFGYFGEMKFKAGEAITADSALTVADSGWFTAAGSGDYIIGRTKLGVTSGSLGTGLFNFNVPLYAFSSSYAW